MQYSTSETRRTEPGMRAVLIDTLRKRAQKASDKFDKGLALLLWDSAYMLEKGDSDQLKLLAKTSH